MLLSKIIWTLPEQQQIDLLTFYASHINVHTATNRQSLFKAFSKGKALAQEDILEDRMLLSDKVIDAYLTVIESGIALCEENKVPLTTSQDAFGVSLQLGWYESDLVTIAGCQRINASHTTRIKNLLRGMTAQIPLEQYGAFDINAHVALFSNNANAMGSPRSGMSIVNSLATSKEPPSYRAAHVAFCSNPAVDVDTLRDLLKPLMTHLELEQQNYASSIEKNSNAGLVYIASTCGTLVAAMINAIIKHRNDESAVLKLLEEIGWYSSRFLNGFEVTVPSFAALCEQLSNIEREVDVAKQREVSEQPVTVSQNLLNKAYEELGLYISVADPLRAIARPNLIDLDCDKLARCCVAAIYNISLNLTMISDGTLNEHMDCVVAYQHIRRKATDMYLEMLDTNLISQETIRKTIRELFLAVENAHRPNSLEFGFDKKYSILSVVDQVIKRQVVGMDFVFECLEEKRLYRSLYNVLLENKGLTSAELERFVDECNELGSRVDDGQIELDPGKQNAKAFFLTHLIAALQNCVPMLLTKEYYPSLLSGGAPSPASLGKLLEYASSMHMIDEGDLELFATGGMAAICQHTGKEFSMAMSKMPDLNEKLIALLLQERMEKTEAAALSHAMGRYI